LQLVLIGVLEKGMFAEQIIGNVVWSPAGHLLAVFREEPATGTVRLAKEVGGLDRGSVRNTGSLITDVYVM
jgi:hypothetical protein